MKRVKNLTEATSREKVVNFMTINKRSYIEDVIQHSSSSAAVDEVMSINIIAKLDNVEFVLYDSDNLSLIILGQSFCPSHSVVIAVTFESNKCHFYIIKQINDKDYLKLFRDVERQDDKIEEETSIKICCIL